MSELLILWLKSITEPFDVCQTAELKFDVESGSRRGELHLRVAASEAKDYTVGDTYVAKMVKVP